MAGPLAQVHHMSQTEAAQATQEGSHPASRTGSVAPSQVGANPAWMEYVRWDGEFRSLNDAAYDQLPEAKKLRELVKKSLTVPTWLDNIKSPEWAPHTHRERIRDYAEVLSDAVSGPGYPKDKDDELSFDVQGSLPFILHIRRHVDSLQAHAVALEPVEADRRHPVDTLGSLVWDTQSDGLVIYRTEQKLAIPHPLTDEGSGDTQPDACAFITLHGLGELPVESMAAVSCFPRTGSAEPDHRYILHWVTEFKRDHDEPTSKSQVVEGLVSALYQRRAFGFPNHFVFGTAHHSRTVLEVLAATWVRSEEPVDTGARSLEENTSSAVLPEDQTNDPLETFLRGDDTTSGAPKIGQRVADVNTDLKDIMRYNKIVVYSIATYLMSATPHLLELYLLMRHTRALARQYKAEIMKDGRNRIRQLLKEAKEFYQWSPPPRPKPKPRSTAEEYRMSIDSYEDSYSRSDSEELELLNDAGPTRRIRGEVGSYTLRNYVYEEDAGATCFNFVIDVSDKTLK